MFTFLMPPPLATCIDMHKLLPAETFPYPAIKPQNVFICDAGEDKSSVFVVEYIPAYNFEVVKYDYINLSFNCTDPYSHKLSQHAKFVEPCMRSHHSLTHSLRI